jgi:hypothetical protein
MDKSQKKYRVFIPTGIISLVGISIYFWLTIHPYIGMRQQESIELEYNSNGSYFGSYSQKRPDKPNYVGLPLIKKGSLGEQSNFIAMRHQLMESVSPKDMNVVLKLALSSDCTYDDFIKTIDIINLANLDYDYKAGVFYIFNYPQSNYMASDGGPVGGYPSEYRSGFYARVSDWWSGYKIQFTEWLQSIVELFTNNIPNQLILLCWLILFIVGIVKNNRVARLTSGSS